MIETFTNIHEVDGMDDPNIRLRKRNAWLMQVLDPDNNLPKIDIKIIDAEQKSCEETLPSDIFEGNAGSLYIMLPGTIENIGDVVYGKDDSTPHQLVLTDFNMSDRFEDKDFDKRLCLEALKALPLGFNAISHSFLSDGGEEIWEWLVQAGVAKIRQEKPSGQLGKYETIF